MLDRRVLPAAFFTVAVAALAIPSASVAGASGAAIVTPASSATDSSAAQARPRPTDTPPPTLPFPQTGTRNRNLNTQAVRVDARRAWTPTGMTVRRGDHLAFEASGEMRAAPGAGAEGPDGGTLTSPHFPVPTGAMGMLIGRVGEGQPFAIGARADDIEMPADGQLFLGVNDDRVDDNSGMFTVRVSRANTALGTSGRLDETAPFGNQAEAFTVSGKQPWTSTGLSVQAGDRLTFRVRGQVSWANGPRDLTGAGGGPIDPQRQPDYPVPALGVAALVGRVGNGAPFAIGASSSPIVMPTSGELFLGINDDFFGDNSGQFTVMVQRAGR